MYKVIKGFADMLDNGFVYKAGDIFPRDRVDVTDQRIAELSSFSNRVGEPLIKAENKAVKEPVATSVEESDKLTAEPKQSRKKAKKSE